MIQEKVIKPKSGWGMLAVEILAVPVGISLFIYAVSHAERLPVSLVVGMIIGAALIEALAIISLFGFQAVASNQARVLLLFAVYKGRHRRIGVLLGQSVLFEEEDLAPRAQFRNRIYGNCGEEKCSRADRATIEKWVAPIFPLQDRPAPETGCNRRRCRRPAAPWCVPR
ncbi:MAG: hypothetical protein KatS3mg105_5182 [Gemmatales bacterium]|nr:MAG: hypothetical protein KatS3mg105_5182 [Gemmatales bacterium]